MVAGDLFSASTMPCMFLLVAWPVSLVAKNTFSDGFADLQALIDDPDVVSALRLTLLVAAASVVINTVFGVGISILLVRYEFPGRRALSALIDLPLSVSPIVVGLSLVLVYGGRGGWFGPGLEDLGFRSEEHTSELQSLMRISYAV